MPDLQVMLNKFLMLVVSFLTIGIQSFGQDNRQRNSTSLLPPEWFGIWKGEVQAESSLGKANTFGMELEIGAHSQSDRLRWKITYEGDQGKSVRDYSLVAEDLAAGRYVVDEGNGIRLETTKIGATLVSLFSVDGQTLVSRYELLPESPPVVLFEIFAASNKSPTTSRVENHEVNSYRVSSRQSARLKRVENSSKSGDSLVASKTQWTKLKTDSFRGKQDDIFFVNDRVGWYANGAGRIYKTIDGGNSWQKQLEQPGTYFRCLAFIDQEHGFAGNIGPGYFPGVSDDCPLYETKDGGNNWTKVETIEGMPVVGLCSLQVMRETFINAGKLDQKVRLIGVGRVGGPVTMILSDDNGKTWQQVDLSQHAAMALDVYFFSRLEGFVAASTSIDVAQSHALILHTKDGGKSWTRVYESKRPYELTWKMSFPTRQTGYVTIQSYNPDTAFDERFLAKTIDGGATWKEVPLVTDAKVRPFGVAFLDESTGWVGAMPHGFFTSDGGLTWDRNEFGNAVNKIRLVPGGQNTIGFAIGTDIHRIEIPNDQR